MKHEIVGWTYPSEVEGPVGHVSLGNHIVVKKRTFWRQANTYKVAHLRRLEALLSLRYDQLSLDFTFHIAIWVLAIVIGSLYLIETDLVLPSRSLPTSPPSHGNTCEYLHRRAASHDVRSSGSPCGLFKNITGDQKAVKNHL